MKTKIFLMLAIVIILAASCRKTLPPTAPAATNTPNAEQTIQAIMTSVASANAQGTAVAEGTQTAVALSFTPTVTQTRTMTPDLTLTVEAIVTMVGNAYATETAQAQAKLTSIALSYTVTFTKTFTCTATQTATPTATRTITPTRTETPTSTASPTATATRTITPTFTQTNTFTITQTFTTSPTPIMTTPPLELINCSDDGIVSYCPVSAVVSVNDCSSIVPLCSGWIIYGDSVRNRVIVRNIISCETAFELPLSAKPNRMAYDRNTGKLFLTMINSTNLVKADLVSKTVTYMPMGGVYDYIAIGNDQTVFLSSYYGNAAPHTIQVVDGRTGNILSYTGSYYDGGEIAYDPVGGGLFVGVTGISPATLYRYTYTAPVINPTPAQNSRDLGSNAQDLTLSPDGTRLLFSTGSGNGSSGYSIFDVNSYNLTISNGSYDTGAYPTSAAFSPDGLQVIATNSYDVKLYDAANHTLIKTLPRALSGNFRFARFSQANRIIYALYRDTYGAGSYSIHWWRN